MSKGYTRRPSAVDRKAYDEAYERTFAKCESPPQIVSTPVDHSLPIEFGVHPCDVADTMTPFFRDGRSRA